MIQKFCLHIMKYGHKHIKKTAMSIKEIEKMNLSISHYIYAVNALRNWADIIIYEKSPKFDKTRASKIKLTIDTTRKSVVDSYSEELNDITPE